MNEIRSAWKLLRLRKNGTLGSLFIGRRAELPLGQWLEAEDIPTKGYAHRPGWHCCAEPKAPHLTEKGRIWASVLISDYETFDRPKHQGGQWLIAKRMKILELQDLQSKNEGET